MFKPVFEAVLSNRGLPAIARASDAFRRGLVIH